MGDCWIVAGYVLDPLGSELVQYFYPSNAAVVLIYSLLHISLSMS